MKKRDVRAKYRAASTKDSTQMIFSLCVCYKLTLSTVPVFEREAQFSFRNIRVALCSGEYEKVTVVRIMSYVSDTSEYSECSK